MNLENLNVTELNAQEKINNNGGFDGPWNYYFDIYCYGPYPGAGWVHYNCGQAVNNPLSGGDDASVTEFVDPGLC